jgi:MOSC domain-containing protein YiiM
MAEVVHLFECLRHRLPMREVAEAEAVVGKGLRSCAHGRPGSKRQVLLMDIETLEAMDIQPGLVKENVTTRGLDMKSLRRGQRLRVGEALLEVTLPCEPCGRMDDIRWGLQEELRGRRGMLCQVVEGGLIRRGDRIEVGEIVARPETGGESTGEARA